MSTREQAGRPRQLAALVLLSLAALGGGSALALPGELDPTFSGDGIVITDLGDLGGSAQAVVSLPGGGVLAAGSSAPGSFADSALVRYLPSGELDPSFGGGDGIVVMALSGGVAARDLITDVLRQPDGSFVVVGLSEGGGNGDFLIARFTAGGSLDESFSPGGIPGYALTDIDANSDDAASAIARREDGTLVVVGSTDAGPGSDHEFALARYDADGNLDSSFSPDAPAGRAFLDVGGIGDFDDATDVALLGDGRMLVAGAIANMMDQSAALVRFGEDGAVDASYGGGDGIAFLDHPGFDATVPLSLVALPDGSAVSANRLANGPRFSFGAAKFAPDGSLDPGFGDGGLVATEITPGDSSAPAEVLREPNDKLVLVGSSAASEFQFVAARYLPDGTLDPTFGGGDGIAVADLGDGGNEEFVSAGALGEDGSVLAAGGDAGDFALARFEGGTPTCEGRDATLLASTGETVGTGTDDVIGGDAGVQAVRAGDGDDLVCGEAGSDELAGEADADRLLGGADSDTLTGDAGADELEGAGGKDVLRGGGGKDQLRGQGARDAMRGGGGKDRLRGHGGKDRLRGQGAKDVLKGGGGDDRLVGGPGDDVLKGGGGTDRCPSGAGDDKVRGCERGS